MLGTSTTRRLATLAVVGGLLAAAGPADAATHRVILYNGHAGLGANLTVVLPPERVQVRASVAAGGTPPAAVRARIVAIRPA